MLNYKSTILLATLIISDLPGLAHAALNDTGITTCSNETQNGLPCPVAGFPGQDAEFGTNSFDFTKLDANGNTMSVAATNHSCVQDNVTGLMWEVKTDDGGLRDKDNTYTFDQAATFATQVNATNLCGHTDWRVPDIKELASIVDYSIPYPVPTIDTDYFPNTPAEWFWSASPLADVADYAWIVYFGYGGDGSGYRASTSRAWLVCAGQSLSFVFTDNANGTITDSNTGLIWAKCPLGQSGTNCEIGSASALTWAQALNAAKNSSLAGCNDWRMPNIQELRSIVDYTKYNPSINSIYFPNTPTEWFWSASPYAGYTEYAWVVSFDYGYDDYYYRTYAYRARLVCAGQVLSFALSVAKAGNGAGSVSSNPAGINCGAVCAANFTQNSSVTLTAAPAAGSGFAGWSGDADCSDGTVTMDAAKNCTATFNLSITVPTATTGTATNITQTSAKLNGTVISSGATATVSFEFGKDTSPPAIVPTLQRGNAYRDAPASRKVAQTDTTTLDHRGLRSHAGAWERSESHYPPLQSWGGVGGGVKSFTYTETISATPSTVYSSTAVAVSANKTGLTCGTVYHFRTKAINSAGTGYGADKTFTTNACQVANSWLFPTNPMVLPNKAFTLTITAKSNSQQIGSYRYEVTFDVTKLAIDYTQCPASNGVCAGIDAPAFFTTNVNYATNPATITLNGLGTIGPGNDLQLLTIHLKSQNTVSSTPVTLKTVFLDNTAGNSIGLGAAGATVNIVNGMCGDADGNTVVNIVDALAIARKVIGLPPPPTVDTTLANVSQDGELSIVDAMHIARYSLGLVVVGTCLILL